MSPFNIMSSVTLYQQRYPLFTHAGRKVLHERIVDQVSYRSIAM